MHVDQVRIRLTVTVTDGTGRSVHRSSVVERCQDADEPQRSANWAAHESQSLLRSAKRGLGK